MALTGKKRLFADAVLAGSSNKNAAIKAGYSASTASAAGSRLVKDPAVAAYLAERRAAVPEGQRPTPGARPFDPANPILFTDPKAFLIAAMNDGELAEKQRVEAAKALMPFMHKKLGEGGKKEQKQEEAEKVASRFKAAPPPRLAAAGGKKV